MECAEKRIRNYEKGIKNIYNLDHSRLGYAVLVNKLEAHAQHVYRTDVCIR